MPHYYERILFIFPNGTKNGSVIVPSGGGVVGNCNIPSICWKLMKITLMHLGAPSLNAIASRLPVVASKNVSYLVIESTQSKNWQTARENWFPSKHPAGGVRRLHSTLVPISHHGACMAYLYNHQPFRLLRVSFSKNSKRRTLNTHCLFTGTFENWTFHDL